MLRRPTAPDKANRKIGEETYDEATAMKIASIAIEKNKELGKIR